MSSLYPLQFQPVLRQYVWGGRRLETALGKPLPPGDHWAECWEICDLDAGQSVVAAGPLKGATLRELVANRGVELLGRHSHLSRFPLLLKFLDAADTLSVQVHPDDALAARLSPPSVGKTEAWVVMDAEPGSLIYAGLKPDVDPVRLAAAIQRGQCQECLHCFHPEPGDCLFLPAGAVHALGKGLLVAEIQQPSELTYRLFDWNRVGLDGKPRPLHIEQGLAAVRFDLGPLEPCQPRETEQPETSRLVECGQFVLDRRQFDSPLAIGGDERFHLIIVLEGSLRVEGAASDEPISRGGAVLLPASLGKTRLAPLGRVALLDAYLP
jgi:mannose-6-phosphate isomerase